MKSLSCVRCLYLKRILISFLLFTEPLFHSPQPAIPQQTSGQLIDWFWWIKGQLMFSLCENSLGCLPAVIYWPSPNVKSWVTKTCQKQVSFTRRTPTWVDRFAACIQVFVICWKDSLHFVDICVVLMQSWFGKWYRTSFWSQGSQWNEWNAKWHKHDMSVKGMRRHQQKGRVRHVVTG